jgi:hypothetical protein
MEEAGDLRLDVAETGYLLARVSQGSSEMAVQGSSRMAVGPWEEVGAGG